MRTKIILRSIVFVFLTALQTIAFSQSAREFYVNDNNGNDQNSGTKEQPFKTLNKAADLVNLANGKGAITIYITEGIYGLDATATFHPVNWHFTKEERLIISRSVAR